jgi:scyllo-inositol 2-dehydrogenase (NADP+)
MQMDIGIVGLGKMGILHASILNALEGCSVTAICEKERLVLEFAKKILPHITFYSDVVSMVNKEKLDAVFVTTPISTHLPILREIIDYASIPVFMEKPLAASYDDASAMAQLSKEKRIITMVGYQKRFAPSFSRAKSILDSEQIGKPLVFRAHSFVSSVFKEGRGWRFKKGEGGALLDLGSHLIDLLTFYFGVPDWVSGFDIQIASSQVEDFAHALLGFKSGLRGYVDVSWSVEGYRLPETKIEVIGSEGRIEVSDDRVFVSGSRTKNDPNNREFTAPDLYEGVSFLIGDPEYCIEDEFFLNSIKNGKEVHPDFSDATIVNKVIAGIHKSSLQKEVVWLDDSKDR